MDAAHVNLTVLFVLSLSVIHSQLQPGSVLFSLHPRQGAEKKRGELRVHRQPVSEGRCPVSVLSYLILYILIVVVENRMNGGSLCFSLTMKRGHEICADPNAEWVQVIVKVINKVKAKALASVAPQQSD